MSSTKLTVRAVGSVAALPPAWDTLDHGPSPFLKLGFLSALEASGSIDKSEASIFGKLRRGSGWRGVYLLAEAGDTLVGAVPAFVKDHSYGEYIFDWGWASASQRAGIPYYPKLVVAAPHTPATGKRMLIAPGIDPEPIREVLASAVRRVADETECTSIHWLFCTEEEQASLARLGFSARATYQFHWHNRGYATFDDFLGQLKSRKRKQLRKERSKAQAAVDRIFWVRGDEMTEPMLDDLDRFYRSTTDNHGGRDYLRPGFFHACAKSLPEMRVVFVEKDGKRIAGALFFETAQGLYGRYWGTDASVDLLHFETAYYAGIDRAIAQKLPLFEAGAQGEHKLVRGFEPAPTYSAHWLRHPGLAGAIDEHLARERVAVAAEIEQLASYGPYRTEDGDD